MEQCRLRSIPRSALYHRPASESAENLALMEIIDTQLMDTPFFGVRQLTLHLRNEYHAMNPKRVLRLERVAPDQILDSNCDEPVIPGL